jgi:hypothetical protein
MSAAEVITRFLVGGLFVSVFAILADVLKPKSFAGLFGAAPSIALATLTLSISKQGSAYASLEARSMIGGALALCIYTYCVARLMMPATWSAKVVASTCLGIWMIAALGFGILFR